MPGHAEEERYGITLHDDASVVAHAVARDVLVLVVGAIETKPARREASRQTDENERREGSSHSGLHALSFSIRFTNSRSVSIFFGKHQRMSFSPSFGFEKKLDPG